MKTIHALAVATTALSSTCASASEIYGSFFVENNNGKAQIVKVWSALAGTNDPWHLITLSQNIKPGYYREFSYHGENCTYDVKILFDDGYEQWFDRVNVCNGSRLNGN